MNKKLDTDAINSSSGAKKLEILFVSSDKFPPFRVDSSILFGEEMVSRGHKIDWLLQSEDKCNKSYRTNWSGCDVWVGKTDNGKMLINRLRKHTFWIIHQMKLFNLLKNNKYDFIQVKNKFVIALVALVAAKIFKIRFTYWLSYPFPEASLYKAKNGIARYPVLYFVRGHILKFLLYKIIMPFADHVFVQSEQMKKDVVAMGISASKLTPVPMGVSLRQFQQFNTADHGIKCSDMAENCRSIVYLGTLERARKMDFMLRVFHIVNKEQPDTKLYFVGGGDSKEDITVLEKTAKELGITNSFVMTGFLPRDEALLYVRDADVCVSPFLPSPILDSTSPTKLVEYMAIRKAVVANDHPEQKLVIEESKGGICVSYDEESFSKGILDILNNPEGAKKMGLLGYAYVKNFRDYKKIADSLESKYFEIYSQST